MTQTINTVLGPLSPDELGATNYHEHAFQVSPLLPVDALDDAELSEQEFARLRESGFDAVVDATPLGLGRRPAALHALARRTGLHVVATTGAHREAHYEAHHPILETPVRDLEAAFVRDITQGMPTDDSLHGPPTDVRAGILKAGIGYWSVSPFERRVIDAVARAHGITDAPVMVHLEFGTAAHEVLDIFDREGVPAHRIVLAHADRNPDPGLHVELAARGAFLGYDGMARPKSHPESTLLALTAAVVESGGGSQLLVGGDVARRTRYESYGGMPGLAYLGTRYIPRLLDAIGESALHQILRVNPRTWLRVNRA